MQDVNIKGKTFTHEEVCEYGKKSIKKSRKILMIVGISLFAVFVFYAFIGVIGSIGALAGIFTTESETGETLGATETLISLLITVIFVFCTYGVAGIILVILSFIKAKKDPFPVGVKYLNKHFPYPLGFDGTIADLLQGDKLIKFSSKPDIALIISSVEHKLQIRKNKRYSRIFNKSEILDYEIRVDNEVLITSKSQTNRGFGKAIVGGVLFGGVGAIAGAMAGNSNTNASQSQKEIHHYTFLLKINDISTPSFVVELSSLQMAEEVATALAIFFQEFSSAKEKNNESQSIKMVEPPVAEKEDNKKQTVTMDKFEEIKKYKELLDMGIISQEEFEVEKNRILK
jgi:hypothetical protein